MNNHKPQATAQRQTEQAVNNNNEHTADDGRNCLLSNHISSHHSRQDLYLLDGSVPALITASFPPVIVNGFPSSPPATVTIGSVYFPSASTTVSPGPAARLFICTK